MEEELISKLPSKFRQNTRRSYIKGLRSKISKIIDYDNYYKLYRRILEINKWFKSKAFWLFIIEKKN